MATYFSTNFFTLADIFSWFGKVRKKAIPEFEQPNFGSTENRKSIVMFPTNGVGFDILQDFCLSQDESKN